ncbi:MAG TPA: MFS transporter [Burkholderiaceae bacterium]|nr:MFS transporter [Burkholderiaceae bacterium]
MSDPKPITQAADDVMTAMPWHIQDGLRYGLLGLPLAFCALPLYVLMPNLYAQQWGVSLAALGFLLMGVRLFDALIDPWLGRLCDGLYAQSASALFRISTLACVALSIGFTALFSPMTHDANALLWWAGAALVLTYTAYSFLSLAYHAWGAMLGGDANFRSRVVAWRESFGLVGVLLATVTPTLAGITAMQVLFVVTLWLGYAAWRMSTRPNGLLAVTAQATPTSSTTPVRTSQDMRLPWKYADFRRLLAVYLLNGIASAIPATLVLFFLQDRLEASVAMQSAALGVYFLFAALSMPLWLKAVAHWGLVRVWLFGMLLSIAVFAGAGALGAGDIAWFLLVCALSGAALGSDLTVPTAMLAGQIQTHEPKQQTAGIYFGWWNFAGKLNLALAAGLALPLLGLLGYVPGARDAQASLLLTLAYCLLPCVLKAAAATLLYFSFIKAKPFTTLLPAQAEAHH